MKRYAVFAHYDAHQKIDDYVLYYLAELKTIADEIVFVSDGNISNDEKNKLKKFVHTIIAERHGEYDFGSYKRRLKILENKWSEGDQLILCNDSVFGPFIPFKQIFRDMSLCNAGMWGIIDSMDHNFLMSFFLVINSTVFLQDYFRTFFTNIKKESCKDDIVIKYEIGLSKLIISKGQKIESWLNTFELTKYTRSDLSSFLTEHNIPVNCVPPKAKISVYDDQNFYLQFMNFPFLKKLLFNDKTCFFPIYYKKIIKKYPCLLIEESVKRLYPSINHNILLVWYHRNIKNIKRFLYQKKITKKNKIIIKICKIPFYSRKINI